MRYWIVKGNTRENGDFDIVRAGRTNHWRTKKPRHLWERGDRVFIYASAPRRELIALAEFRGETGTFTDEGEVVYRLHYFTDPVECPVTASVLKADPVVASANFLKRAVAQGVLQLTPEQAQRMYQLLRLANPSLDHFWMDIPLDGALALPDIDEIFSEGAEAIRPHLVRERNRAAVAAKKRKVLSETGRLACEACGFDFRERYGPLGDGFCEVHHRVPLAELPVARSTELADLAIVCSNCHRIIHRVTPFLTVDDLKGRLRRG